MLGRDSGVRSGELSPSDKAQPSRQTTWEGGDEGPGEAADRRGPRGDAAILGGGSSSMHTRTSGVSGLARVWGTGKGEPGVAPKPRIKEAGPAEQLRVLW